MMNSHRTQTAEPPERRQGDRRRQPSRRASDTPPRERLIEDEEAGWIYRAQWEPGEKSDR